MRRRRKGENSGNLGYDIFELREWHRSVDRICVSRQHKSTSSDLVTLQQQRQHTMHGEELPYVLGVPLDGGKYDLRGRYDIRETLFSEAIMNWWCSFAYIG